MNEHPPSNQTRIIYLFSGLGADERIFERINFQNYTPLFVQWIAPLQDETIQNYATRLRAQIKTEKPLILGVSFGGMIATEIAKKIECEHVILVSTAKTKYEIPFLYRLAGRIHLHKIIPARLLKQANFITCWFFGMKTSPEKQLLRSILADTDTVFLRWAIDAILKWDCAHPVSRKIHIHGTLDRILPLRYIRNADYEIKDGGHLMIYNSADEINLLLKDLLT